MEYKITRAIMFSIPFRFYCMADFFKPRLWEGFILDAKLIISNYKVTAACSCAPSFYYLLADICMDFRSPLTQRNQPHNKHAQYNCILPHGLRLDMQATDFQHSPACNGEEMKHYMQSGSHMLGCGFVPAVIFSFQKVYSNVKVMTNYILITLYISFSQF